MTKKLKALLRISDWNVDQAHRKIRLLNSEVYNLEVQINQLNTQELIEKDIATAQPIEGGFSFGIYAEQAKRIRYELLKKIEDLNVKIESAREELRLAYLEAKKYEIAQRKRDESAQLEADRAEQVDLDEVGIIGYINKQ
jgi:flagellar export protein FliJ